MAMAADPKRPATRGIAPRKPAVRPEAPAAPKPLAAPVLGPRSPEPHALGGSADADTAHSLPPAFEQELAKLTDKSRMPSKAAIVSGSSFSTLAPVVSPIAASVTMPPRAPTLPSAVDPIGATLPFHQLPMQPVVCAPPPPPAPSYVPPAPPSQPAYERAFRRWSQPSFDMVPEDVPSTAPLSFQVYTPDDLGSARLRTSSEGSFAPPPRGSLAIRAAAVLLGIGMMIGVAFVGLAAVADEPSARATNTSAAAPPPPATDLPATISLPAGIPQAPQVIVAPTPAPPTVAPPAKPKPKTKRTAPNSPSKASAVLAPPPNPF